MGREFLRPPKLFQESAQAEVRGTDKQREAYVVANCPPDLGLYRMNGGRQGIGWHVLAHRRVQLEAPVVQVFLLDFEEALRGFAGAADGPIVKVDAVEAMAPC